MAQFDMTFPDDILDGLLDTPAEEICVDMLNAAAPVLVENMKKEARKAVMHEGESEMVESIHASKPKRTKDETAYIVTVGPGGYSNHMYYDKKSRKKRKYRVGNALKAIWKEYGIAGKQAPRPFIGPATRNSEEKALEEMQDVYRKKVGEEDGY